MRGRRRIAGSAGTGALRWRLWIATLVGLALGSAGCARDGSSDADGLLVFAAADLQIAFAEVETAFEAATGENLTIVFGSTGNMAAQIAHGAPADVFFAANESYLDALLEAGHIDPTTRIIYATGRLAIVWRPGTPEPTELRDLANPAFETIAIANPEHAPYGVAGREALASAGIWDDVLPRLVYGENILQTLRLVETGNADAALVALGLLLGPNPVPHTVVPTEAHTPLRQAAGGIAASYRPSAARRFLDFVVGTEGQEILRRHGFDPPAP